MKIIKNLNWVISGVGFVNQKTMHIEIPVEILEFVSCETPLQGEYTERVNKLLKK